MCTVTGKIVIVTVVYQISHVRIDYFYGIGETGRLMVGSRRRPWTIEAPEALQVRCRTSGG